MKIEQHEYQAMPEHLRALFTPLPNSGSDEVVGLFPVTTSGAVKHPTNNGANQPINMGGGMLKQTEGSTGSAARFFYCAKASKRDRDEGCEGVDVRLRKTHGDTGPSDNAKPNGQKAVPARNHHPTVKPTDLMKYLVRLITPPGGRVLDPFAGSGSTGKAAVLEGFTFTGIEREAEYMEIMKARIGAAIEKANQSA